MKKLLILPAVLSLSACQISAPEQRAETQRDQEHQIAAQINASCRTNTEVAEDHFDCETATSGTIPVTHPVEDVDLSAALPDAGMVEEVTAVEPEVAPPVTDLWQRIRHQLTFDVPQNRRIEVQRNWYLKHPSYMERVSKRARPFLHLIIERLEQADMPLELALLPIVESAFDPFAYSHGRAAGMWQFIPATGKRFGMKQTWWYDGRRDVLASTDGAINYLNYLLKMFDGNWLHALAAYNSGEGRVLKAIRKNKKAGKPTDFWSLDLPRETRAYVPKLLALSDILKRADEFNFDWPSIDNVAVTQVVETGSQIDLALAADMAGLTVEQLHALNPGYNRWATDPDGPHTLLLPADKVDTFEAALASTEDKERLNWVRHKVKSGDSLLKLAKDYHTTVDIIRQVNDMRGNVIVAGKYLLIPVALKSLDSYALSQDQRLVKTQSHKRAAHKLTHKVKQGDTMWDLSREYKVNLRSLAKWNGMAPTDVLRPGKELVIWVNQVSEGQRENAVVRALTYTVKRGDSLARIASRFNVRIRDIQQWNQINPKKYLQPGQKLKLFVDVTRT